MFNGKTTNYEEVLAALITQINSVTSIATNNIIPTLSEAFWEPDGLADTFVLISNFQGQIVQNLQTGGGTNSILWNTQQDIVLVKRLDIDTPGSDYNRLTKQTLGLLDTWQVLLKAIEQWNPTSGVVDPTGILAEPGRCYGFQIKPRPMGRAGGWVQVRTKYQMVFNQDMS